MLNRPRLLIPLTYHFSVRYIVRTGLLNSLLPFSQPVIGLGWQDQDLSDELRSMGVEVAHLPTPRYGTDYSRLRKQIDTWYYDYRLRTVSTIINERRKNIGLPISAVLIKQVRRLFHRLKLLRSGEVSRILNEERRLVESDTNLRECDEFIKRLNIQSVFSVTPYHREEELILRAAAFGHLPTCTSIISFDNLTSRPWMPVLFDYYMVWNRYNAAELHRAYPETINRPVAIVGPAQFDFYWQPEYIWSETQWRELLSLPENRPVMLYAGGPPAQIPHEPGFIQQIDNAISEGKIPGKPIILFRRHPVDSLERWQPVLQQCKHVFLDEPWSLGQIGVGNIYKFSNVTNEDIARLVSTLYHTKVHVSVCSTMALDGAVFGKPQIGPAYDDSPTRKYDRTIRELYQKEHYLPIVRSGGVSIAYNRDELIALIAQDMLEPQSKSEQRQEMLQEICTFLDGNCTERVATGIRNFLRITYVPANLTSVVAL